MAKKHNGRIKRVLFLDRLLIVLQGLQVEYQTSRKFFTIKIKITGKPWQSPPHPVYPISASFCKISPSYRLAIRTF